MYSALKLLSGKRSLSFQWAVNSPHSPATHHSYFSRMVHIIADEFLVEPKERKYYADHYSCWPPPLFVPLITLVQLFLFLYYESLSPPTTVSVLSSPFVYSPHLRGEVWRFLTYSLLHAGWPHLMFNLLVQVLVGLPLEMVHGSLRVLMIYCTGVLAGSLGTSVLDSDVHLIGGSGGVYALLTAHIANVLLNYHNMKYGLVRLVSVVMAASIDLAYAIYMSYMPHTSQALPVSYIAHIIGAMSGILVGVVVLKNFSQKLHTQLSWWLSLALFLFFVCFCILFNLLSRDPYLGVVQMIFGTESSYRDEGAVRMYPVY